MIFSQSNVGHLRQRVGHDFMPDETAQYLINVGSVGQPRDHDPRACYVIYDTSDSEPEVTYHRVTYNIQLTQSKMTQAEAPTMLIERLAVGR
jgi:diadenosine tetraphosphatase ApaH/serine/threonine PP2A family protein phosphatase